MQKYQIKALCALFVCVNFAIFPYFLDVSSTAKILFFLLFFLLQVVIFQITEVPHTFLVSIFFVLLLETLFSSGLISYKLPFFSLVLVLVVYTFYVRQVFLSSPAVFFKNLIASISILSVFVSALGLYEFFNYSFLGPSKKMLIPYLLPANINFRVAGIYGQPNLFSMLLLLGILTFFYQSLHNSDFHNSRLNLLKYLPFCLVCVVFFLTRSRSGYLSFGFCYLYVLWAIVRNKYLNISTDAKGYFCRLSFCILISIVTGYFLDTFFSGSKLIGVITSDPYTNTVNIESRFVFWISALLMFFDHPWFGIGFNNFQIYLPKYVNSAYDFLGFVQYEAMGHTKWAHNELLQLLCEGGVFVTLIIVFFVGRYLRKLYLFLKGTQNWSPQLFYSHLFLLPFFIQSMFTWTMRQMPLVVLFFTFLGVLLAQYPLKSKILGGHSRLVVRMLSFLSLVLVLFVGYQDIQAGSFYHSLNRQNIPDSLEGLSDLTKNPFLKIPLLNKVLPRYVSYAVQEKKEKLAGQIAPYLEELTLIQGTYGQWYNLAVVLNLMNQPKRSKLAINKAIELRPAYDPYWEFLHYLNVLKACEETGKPIEQFLPYDHLNAIDADLIIDNVVETLNASNRMYKR